jgi:hypothetical protein
MTATLGGTSFPLAALFLYSIIPPADFVPEKINGMTNRVFIEKMASIETEKSACNKMTYGRLAQW